MLDQTSVPRGISIASSLCSRTGHPFAVVRVALKAKADCAAFGAAQNG
jgi:hypothetical protein